MNFESGLRSMESKHRTLTILRCKIVVVGDACVGKTALTQVFVSGGATYPKNYMMTTGAEFAVKQVPIENTNSIVEFYIFDCAGQSIFNQMDMNAKYYENAAAVLLVYDIGNHETLQASSKWIQSVRKATATSSTGGSHPSRSSQLIGAMVGNKADFREDKDKDKTQEGNADSRVAVSTKEAESLAKELDLKYFEVSAQSNLGVEDPFKYIANEFYRRYEDVTAKADSLAFSSSSSHER